MSIHENTFIAIGFFVIVSLYGRTAFRLIKKIYNEKADNIRDTIAKADNLAKESYNEMIESQKKLNQKKIEIQVMLENARDNTEMQKNKKIELEQIKTKLLHKFDNNIHQFRGSSINTIKQKVENIIDIIIQDSNVVNRTTVLNKNTFDDLKKQYSILFANEHREK